MPKFIVEANSQSPISKDAIRAIAGLEQRRSMRVAFSVFEDTDGGELINVVCGRKTVGKVVNILVQHCSIQPDVSLIQPRRGDSPLIIPVRRYTDASITAKYWARRTSGEDFRTGRPVQKPPPMQELEPVSAFSGQKSPQLSKERTRPEKPKYEELPLTDAQCEKMEQYRNIIQQLDTRGYWLDAALTYTARRITEEGDLWETPILPYQLVLFNVDFEGDIPTTTVSLSPANALEGKIAGGLWGIIHAGEKNRPEILEESLTVLEDTIDAVILDEDGYRKIRNLAQEGRAS